MRFILAVVLAVLVSLGSARAEQIHLTMQKAIEVLDGLAQLSAGNTRVVKEGAQERVVQEHYKGWSVGLIDAQKKDIIALRDVVQSYEQARQQRERDLSDDQGKLTKAAQSTLAKEAAAELSKDRAYDLDRFKEGELLLDQNTITPGVLANLAPILAPEK